MARADKSALISQAVAALRAGEFPDYSKAAAHFGVDRTSISKRVRGQTVTRQEANSLYLQCLTCEQEEELIGHINRLTDRGMPPTSQIVRNLAVEIRGCKVGKNWVGQFIHRHKNRLKSLYLRNIDNLRVGAEYMPLFKLFFDTLLEKVEKYHITADNLYNFDEKGFLMGLGRTVKRVMTVEALQSGRITKSRQDGSREFISLLACVSAIGKAIPPLLVYRGESGDLYSSWVQDVDEDAGAHFAVTSNGWSNNEMGMAWLQQVFERYTKPQRATSKRLLIVDGHSSHVNMAFVDWADQHGIIILILPPHTTHRLQPLDVGLFQPLSTAYSEELENLMADGESLVSMSKRFFWLMFKVAWRKSFTEENIQHAFAKPGIWPIAPDQILSKITRPTVISSPRLAHEILPPKSAKSLRQFHLEWKRNPDTHQVEILFKTTQSLVAEVSILNHVNQGLRKAIQLQKQKGGKGKKLDLAGEETAGVVAYSPAKVVRCREYATQKETIEIAKTKEKEERKIQRAINSLKTQQEKEARQAAAQLAKDLRSANLSLHKARSKKTKAVAIKAKKAAPTVPKATEPSPKRSPHKRSVQKRVLLANSAGEAKEEVVTQNRRGRQIKLPTRFK